MLINVNRKSLVRGTHAIVGVDYTPLLLILISCPLLVIYLMLTTLDAWCEEHTKSTVLIAMFIGLPLGAYLMNVYMDWLGV